MRRTLFTTMLNFLTTIRKAPHVLCLAAMLAIGPAFAADTPAPQSDVAAANRAASSDKDAIVSTTPMELEAEAGAGASGQFVVAPEILSVDGRGDLIYTITSEPRYGRVGLSGGGEQVDFFKNKTARLGYFAYRPDEGYAGEDS